MTNKKSHIVVFEEGKRGYILVNFQDFEEAKEFAENAFKEAQQDRLVVFMAKNGYYRPIAFYRINGNCVFFFKEWSQCDGYSNISVVEMELNSYNLQSFIKERQNTSYLVSPSCDDEEKLRFMNISNKFRGTYLAN